MFTNQGAAVQSWLLTRYHDDKGNALQLIDEEAFKDQPKPIPLPFTIEASDVAATAKANQALYQAKPTPDGLGIDYEYSDGSLTVRKSFRFQRDSYLVDVKSTVLTGSTPVQHYLNWRGGFGDSRAFRAATTERSVRYDATAAS